MERRSLACPLPVQFRSEGEKRAFVGYGSVFFNGTPETEYRIWDDYIERIMPGTFDRAIRESQDVRGLFNHDSNFILGRSTAGTLTLSIDAKGLRYEMPFDEKDPDHVKVASKMERGDVSGSSFSFVPTSWVYRVEDEITYCEITDCDLYDVGPVTFPAYEGATSGMRALRRELAEASRQEALAWRESQGKDLDQFLLERRRDLVQQKGLLSKI